MVNRSLSRVCCLAWFAVGCLTMAAFSADRSADRQAAIAAARQIDMHVHRVLQQADIEPNAPLTDEQFLRRVYLDVIGRIPTHAEARAFLDSTHSDKRARLIDDLLDSEGYVSNFYNYYADILRIQTRLNNNVPGEPYIDWLKTALRENRHWDDMVRELITAEGYIWENGAAGYYLRDAGMPLDNLSNTVRIFLGTQLGCAQCHDHPFDKWTQYEFYEMAAFTTGIQTRTRGNIDYRELRRKAGDLDPRQQQVIRRLVRPLRFKVHEQPKRVLRLPEDYKYDDAKPKDKVEPMTIFGHAPELTSQSDRVDLFADWLTGRDNPRFAMTIANRLWAKLFGHGIVHPVDDVRDDSLNTNPKLLEYLSSQMVVYDFDLKQYLRMVLNSRAYQRAATRIELDPEKPYYFPSPTLRRMTAEQVWDSLLTLRVENLDIQKGVSRLGRLAAAPVIAEMDTDELIAVAKNPRKLRAMVRGEMDPAMMRMAMQARRGGGNQYVRASELTSPARPGHFIRTFGQSDREQIEAATTEPSITQALQLLNGEIDRQLTRRDAVLYKTVDAASGTRAKIDALWLSILTRQPTHTERRLAEQEIAAHEKQGYANLVWALLNTREFLFIQ